MHFFLSLEQNFLFPSSTLFPCFLLFRNMSSFPPCWFSLNRKLIFYLLAWWSPTHSLSVWDLKEIILLSEFPQVLNYINLSPLISVHETDWSVHFQKICYKMVLHCLVCFQTLILYQGHLQDLNISISRHHIIILKPQYEKGFFCHLICISAFTAITLDHVILVSRCGSLFSGILFILQLNIYRWDSCYVVFLIYLIDRLFKQKR